MARDGQQAKPQIGCYMAAADAAKLTDYARNLGVKRSLLVFLLVLRELNCQRLPFLHEQFPYEGKKPGRGRVTARLTTEALKTRFEAHIANHGIRSDEAAWSLFQAELSEKWLENSLWQGNQS